MMNKSLIYQVLSFIIYLIVQVVLLKNLILFDQSFCFLYVVFLLLLPVETSTIWLMVIAFLTGFTIDVFYDSLGIHASASVFIMFVRNYWLNLLTPQGGYDSGAIPTIRLSGWQWFSFYVLPLVFLHHTVLFYIEAAGFNLFGFTFAKVFFSTIFTFIVIMITQYLFYNKRKTL